MMMAFTIPPEMRARVEAIAARYGVNPSEIVADALENGHSLAWQEMYLEKVAAGLKAADEGDFATASEIEAVRNKYRQG
jgi:predicted transcriptional regulator